MIDPGIAQHSPKAARRPEKLCLRQLTARANPRSGPFGFAWRAGMEQNRLRKPASGESRFIGEYPAVQELEMNWDTLFLHAKYCLQDPAEEVIKFVEYLREPGISRVLDHGFGAGRHVIFLARHGFEVSGIDISQNGCSVTQRWLDREGLTADLCIADMGALPYERAYFDAVISRGVVTHDTRPRIQQALDEIARVLRPEGLVLCTFISTESSMMGKGERIDDRTWICDDEMEAGIIHHFMDQDDVRRDTHHYFHELKLYHLKHAGLIDTGRPYVSAHWAFIGRRKHEKPSCPITDSWAHNYRLPTVANISSLRQ